MPISVTGRWIHSRAAGRRAVSPRVGWHTTLRAAPGFTLIEMLVVVLIIGVVLTFATLSVNPTGPADRLDTAAKRLRALTHAAAEDAVLYGREIGLDITPGGYRFLRLGNDGWQPIVGSQSPLRPRKLGGTLGLALISKDQDQAPLTAGSDDDADDADQDEQDAARPEAVFLSSGELLPFRLALAADDVDHRFVLSGQANGDMTLERVEAGP